MITLTNIVEITLYFSNYNQIPPWDSLVNIITWLNLVGKPKKHHLIKQLCLIFTFLSYIYIYIYIFVEHVPLVMKFYSITNQLVVI